MLTGDQVFELFNKHGLINAGPIKDGTLLHAFFEKRRQRPLSMVLARLQKFNAEAAMNYAALNYTGWIGFPVSFIIVFALLCREKHSAGAALKSTRLQRVSARWISTRRRHFRERRVYYHFKLHGREKLERGPANRKGQVYTYNAHCTNCTRVHC